MRTLEIAVVAMDAVVLLLTVFRLPPRWWQAASKASSMRRWLRAEPVLLMGLLLPLLAHLVIERGKRVDRRLNGGEIRQVEVGTDINLSCELDHLTVLQLGDLDLGLAERSHLGFGESGLVGGLHGVVDGLLEDHPPAEALIDDDGRHLALAESRDADLLCDLLVGLVEMGLEISKGDLYG